MIRLIIVVPFLLALVVFSASNQDPLDMWLLTYSWKSSAGVLALLVAALAFLLGAFCLWVVELRQRRRARKAELQVRELQAQLTQVQAQLQAQLQAQMQAFAPQPSHPGVDDQTSPAITQGGGVAHD
ncbi:MAG: lipopolysaccharide assembly protein LapA domain-containing protein [Acetobacter sp.]|uniref:lipopolysaccharide assembly protein LapA domain-containing protein n=1 Tax=Acetobacter sp. TaxID=440 RepID=UPI0039E8CCA8